jgi:hypothetical protein
MNGTVFTIDGHNERPWGAPQWLHNWASGNETFFIGQSQTLSGTQSFERHWQTSKAHHSIHNNVGHFNNIGERGGDMGKRQSSSNLKPTPVSKPTNPKQSFRHKRRPTSGLSPQAAPDRKPISAMAVLPPKSCRHRRC